MTKTLTARFFLTTGSTFLTLLLGLAGCGNSVSTADMSQGLTCTAYCSRIMTNCAGANHQYTSMTTCLNSCAAYPPGVDSDKSGNTLGCRIYHAGAAGMDPTTHCRHAGPGGDTQCGDNCT